VVRLEFIVMSYHLMIFKTHVLSVYSHLCIDVSMYLYRYTSLHSISELAAGGISEQFEVHLRMKIK